MYNSNLFFLFTFSLISTHSYTVSLFLSHSYTYMHRYSGAGRNAVMKVSKWIQITCLDCAKTHRFFGQPLWPKCQCTSVPSCIWTAAILSAPAAEAVETGVGRSIPWASLFTVKLFQIYEYWGILRYCNDTVPLYYILYAWDTFRLVPKSTEISTLMCFKNLQFFIIYILYCCKDGRLLHIGQTSKMSVSTCPPHFYGIQKTSC